MIVRGRVFVADQDDVQINASYIHIDGGKFIAGTEQNPFQHKLTINLLGSPPIGRNSLIKGIICTNCKLSLYGQPRLKTWTQLSTTVNVGSSTFTVEDDIDWQVG